MTTALIVASLALPPLGLLGYLYRRYRGVDTDMGFLAFYARLVRGKGVVTVGPARVDRILSSVDGVGVVVDLRAPVGGEAAPVAGAVAHPFDDFLRDVVVDGAYGDRREGDLVLVCDHGHLSRIAGDLLVEEEGFERVLSLGGGTEALARYRAAAQRACCSRASLSTP